MAGEPGSKFPLNQGGVLADLVGRIKLILRLMADKRVNPWIKVLPLSSALYFIIPDIAPGPIDDMAIIWFGMYLFLEMCPPDIVQEHMDMLGLASEERRGEVNGSQQNPGKIVDGEIRDKEA